MVSKSEGGWGRASRNLRPFEGEFFDSIAAKILGEGAISPGPQPSYSPSTPNPLTFPSAPVPTALGGWMAHGIIIIIFPAAIIHTSKQVESIKTVEFLDSCSNFIFQYVQLDFIQAYEIVIFYKYSKLSNNFTSMAS